MPLGPHAPFPLVLLALWTGGIDGNGGCPAQTEAREPLRLIRAFFERPTHEERLAA